MGGCAQFSCCAVGSDYTSVTVASDGDIPYEGYVPMYADVDVLRRGSF